MEGSHGHKPLFRMVRDSSAVLLFERCPDLSVAVSYLNMKDDALF